MSIEITDLEFHYGERVALDSVSFGLKQHGFNALLGPNGAGKSTLFALLTRLYSLQKGNIEINGKSIKQFPAKVMREIGVVFQQSTLDLDLTVTQNLMYHGSLHGLSRSETRLRMGEELGRLNLVDRANDKVRGLNGGHRRRLEIARALLHQPSILLLDEPTVGLDPATRQLINEHVHELCEKKNLTVLWSTHLIDEVRASDPVVVLHQGRVMAADTSEAICAQLSCDSLAEAFQSLTSKQAS